MDTDLRAILGSALTRGDGGAKSKSDVYDEYIYRVTKHAVNHRESSSAPYLSHRDDIDDLFDDMDKLKRYLDDIYTLLKT